MIEYPKKVLLATDGTEDSARAASVAAALAGRAGAELHMVHVGQTAMSAYGVAAEGGPLPGEPAGYAEREARRLLTERQVEEVRADGGSVTEAHLRIGRLAREAVGLSEKPGADPLVVGSGRPRQVRCAASATVRRAAVGRAADVIVRSAHCPVLVVHGGGVPRISDLTGKRCPFTREITSRVPEVSRS